MGKAEVQDRGGSACFSVARDEMKRTSRQGLTQVTALFVSDVSDSPAVEVWALVAEPPTSAINLADHDCISYGKAPANSSQTAARPLVKNRVYSVAIQANLLEPSDSTRAFVAKFCLLADRQNPKLVILQIHPGSDAWRANQCPAQ